MVFEAHETWVPHSGCVVAYLHGILGPTLQPCSDATENLVKVAAPLSCTLPGISCNIQIRYMLDGSPCRKLGEELE